MGTKTEEIQLCWHPQREHRQDWAEDTPEKPNPKKEQHQVLRENHHTHYPKYG